MFKSTIRSLLKFPRSITVWTRMPNVTLLQNYTINLLCSHNINMTGSGSHKKKIMFAFNENTFAYNIIDNFKVAQDCMKVEVRGVASEDGFDALLNQNWRDSSAKDIVDTFNAVKRFCIQNEISVSDTRFDNLVDGVTDHCDHFTRDQIIELLTCLTDLPRCDSYQSHNFHDLWSCLDDVCCWKMIEWDLDTCLAVGNLWYKLNLAKYCDYFSVLLDRNTKRADRLSKRQLLNIFFFLNTCRKRAVDFEYEFALEHLIDDMNVDEMAIVSMGYFKTKTKIKIPSIIDVMIRRVTENAKDIHEISLSAILKVLRYSKPKYNHIQHIDIMLDKLVDEIPRLSCLCCLHMALISTAIQTYHRKSLKLICDKMVKDITDVRTVRLKDIERILNVLTMFNFNPETEPDIFKSSFEEIHKEQRLHEELRYPRSLVSTLHLFTLNEMYSYELLNRVLDGEYISVTFGKRPINIPLELFSLDRSIGIECPDYEGNRLDPNRMYKAAKWLAEYVPSPDRYKRISATDQLFLDILHTVKTITGEGNYVAKHVLPHFVRADIIVCKNKNTNEYIKPPDLDKYAIGDIMYPVRDDGLGWFAIVVVGWNNTAKDSYKPLGHVLMKKRQLEKVGYRPILVKWNEFLNLSADQKREYILCQLTA